jgi:enamine deaminase RidA (YjgF/YER057c/UK114 family)
MRIEERMRSLGYILPEAPPRGGVYMPCKEFGGEMKLAYLSGCGPAIADSNITGKLGREVSFEDGCRAAENCVLNLLAVLKKYAGDLDRVANIVKMTAFVASDDTFYNQPQVANAATELLVKIFGEEIGCPSRSAIGVNVLPGDIAVEIELLVRLS